MKRYWFLAILAILAGLWAIINSLVPFTDTPQQPSQNQDTPTPGKIAQQRPVRPAPSTSVVEHPAPVVPAAENAPHLSEQITYSQILDSYRSKERASIVFTTCGFLSEDRYLRQIVIKNPYTKGDSKQAMKLMDAARTTLSGNVSSDEEDEIHMLFNYNSAYKIVNIRYLKSAKTGQWRSFIQVDNASRVEAVAKPGFGDYYSAAAGDSADTTDLGDSHVRYGYLFEKYTQTDNAALQAGGSEGGVPKLPN